LLVLLMVVLLLMLLLLLKGACVITHLPTSRAENGGAMKTETKWGYDIPLRRLSFKALSLFLFFSLCFSPTQKHKRSLEDSWTYWN
jgi:hypothetical protein